MWVTHGRQCFPEEELLTAHIDKTRVTQVRLARYVPGGVLGVFLARVVGEQMGLPGLWAAVALSVAAAIAGGWLLSRFSLRQTWPALILLAYVVYPEPSRLLALQVAVVAIVAYLVNRFGDDGRFSTLASPTRSERLDWLPALLLAFIFFAVYLVTLAPDVLPADSGELQIVAAQLGVAHPPGFPLYVMAAHLFTRLLPFVSPAYAVNLFSAITGALTVAVVYLAGVTLTGNRPAGIAAAVALATATTFWSQATTANVRSLTGLLAALIILTLLQFQGAVRRGDRANADRRLILVALSMGFGVTHHVSLLFLVVVGLVFIVLVDPALLRSPRRWIKPILAASLGLLPLIYFPLRAAADVRGASADLATWPGFLEHVLATGFRGDLFYYLAPADLWQRLRIIGNILNFQFTLWVLIGTVVGFLLLTRRDRNAALLLGGAFLIFAFVAATYRAPQTVEYLIPGYVALTILLAPAVAWSAEEGERFGWAGRSLGVLGIALVFVGVVMQFPDHLSASGREHEADSARDYAGRLLADAPAGSVILAHWHWATPLWYLQEVEGARPDVVVKYVFPEGEPYEATWTRRTREEIAAGNPTLTTWVPATAPADLPVSEPVGEALLYPTEPRTSLPPGFVPADVVISDRIRIVGYSIEPPADQALSPGDESVLTLAWQALDILSPDSSLFTHYIGPGEIVFGQDDRPATAADGITLTRFRVVPRPATPLGALTVYVGLTSARESAREALTAVEVAASPRAPYTRNRTERVIAGAPSERLIGYDWDHTLPDRSRLYLHWRATSGDYHTEVVDDAAIDQLALPPYRGPWGVAVEAWQFPRGRDGGHYVPLGEGIVWTGETFNGLSLVPDETVVIDQEFHSARPINRDYIVSVRLIGLEPDGVHWAWWDLSDSVPAMGAIPTLKWVVDSFVRSPHRVTVAETAAPGQALTGALTLYDSFTNRPLAILDERMTAENPWIPLCEAVVEGEIE